MLGGQHGKSKGHITTIFKNKKSPCWSDSWTKSRLLSYEFSLNALPHLWTNRRPHTYTCVNSLPRTEGQCDLSTTAYLRKAYIFAYTYTYLDSTLTGKLLGKPGIDLQRNLRAAMFSCEPGEVLILCWNFQINATHTHKCRTTFTTSAVQFDSTNDSYVPCTDVFYIKQCSV